MSWEIDQAWGLKPSPSLATTLPCVNERLIPYLAAGLITSVAGIAGFSGAKSLGIADGNTLEDIDVVVLATGYTNDMTLTPWVKRSSPANYGGPVLPRLYLQIFPPENAESVAFLNTYNATDCAWVLGELCSMAIAQLWSGKSTFPSQPHMESSINKQQKLNARLWRRTPSVERGAVRPGEFYRFLHSKAGTGLHEALGWGLSGWRFWWRDREMARLMGWGIVTPHMMRLIETGKRKTWSGAREALRRANADAKKTDKPVNKFRLEEARKPAD